MRRPRIVPAYRPGSTALHRLAPGPKLLALALVALPVVALRGPGDKGGGPGAAAGGAGLALGLGAAVLVAALVGHLAVRTPRTVLTGALLRLAPAVLAVSLYQGFTRGWAAGAEVAVDLTGLVLLAALVTVTTPTDRMLDAIASGAAPLRLVPALRQTLSAERVALTFTLALRSIDVLWDCATEARDAARARGRGRDVRAIVTPTVIRAVAHARSTGDALAARGLVD